MGTRSPTQRPAPAGGPRARPPLRGGLPRRERAPSPAGATPATATPAVGADARLVAIVVEPFPLWLAERQAPDLARTPLVACDEGRVLHANPPARRWGIDRGMRLAGARLRAPSLAIAASDEPGLAQGWRELVRELLGWTPWLDAGQRGRAFVRLSEAEAEALAVRLNARVGIADDLETAELAALAARPGQARGVASRAEDAFLRRLPLRFLRGVGLAEGDLTRLHWLGLASAGDLAAWSPAQLRAYLGEGAAVIAPYLHGPRRQRLTSWAPPTVLRRRLAFERPLFEPADLEPALDQLARSLALGLEGRAARHVTVATEGGGGPRRASRLAKRPLRAAGQIRQQALFALRDSGAAAGGIDDLAIELAEPERVADAVGLWDARRQQEAAVDAVLERYPRALVRVRWGDPHAPAADQAWRWSALEDGSRNPATAGDAASPARRSRRQPALALLEAPLGAVAPAALYASPPAATPLTASDLQEAARAVNPPPPGAALPSPTEVVLAQAAVPVAPTATRQARPWKRPPATAGPALAPQALAPHARAPRGIAGAPEPTPRPSVHAP
jgi:protein ImuB